MRLITLAWSCLALTALFALTPVLQAQDRAGQLGSPRSATSVPAVGVVPHSTAAAPATPAAAAGTPTPGRASVVVVDGTAGSAGDTLEDIPEPPRVGTPAGDATARTPQYAEPQYAAPQNAAGPNLTDAHTYARLRALEGDLNILSMRGAGSPFDGILNIVMGGLSITIGALINGTLSPYLYLYGGGGVARGILQLVLLQDPSGMAVRFSHLPMNNSNEVAARLQYGEASLSSLATRAEIGRILDASLSLGIGLAIVPVYMAPNNFEFRSAFDYFVIVAAAISCVTGVIGLLSTSDAERRWAAYVELRDSMLRVRPTASVLPGGGRIGVEGTF